MATSRNGVTLVELIVVVLILGVMTFVVVPRMGLSLITAGKTQTTARKITAAIRYARSLAISNAANYPQGFRLDMTGAGSYTGYQIINISTSDVNDTGSIDSSVSCTGADDFIFKPLGYRAGDTDSLTVSGGGRTYVISVVTATGMVKCEEQ